MGRFCSLVVVLLCLTTGTVAAACDVPPLWVASGVAFVGVSTAVSWVASAEPKGLRKHVRYEGGGFTWRVVAPGGRTVAAGVEPTLEGVRRATRGYTS